MTNETIPDELANNSCMALKAIVVNNSGMLTTKMQIKLVDCYNNSVYVTEEFSSKEKDYKKAYEFLPKENLNRQMFLRNLKTNQREHEKYGGGFLLLF